VARARFRPAVTEATETIEIVDMATAGKSVDYDGEIFELDGMSLELPTPIEMPIDVAALGPKGVELAGRFADGWVRSCLRRRDSNDGWRTSVEAPRWPTGIPNRCVPRFYSERVHSRTATGQGPRSTTRRVHDICLRAVLSPVDRRAGIQRRWSMVEEVAGRWFDGDRKAAMEAINAEVLDGLVACGTPEEVNAVIDDFAAVDGCDAVRIGWLGPAEDDAIDATMEAVAPSDR